MPDEPVDFRQKLFEAQAMSPGLRDAYAKEVQTMLNPALTPRQIAPGIALLVMLAGLVGGIVWASFHYRPGASYLLAWITLAAALAYAAWLILRDLWRGKHSRKSLSSISGTLYAAGGVLTVVALLKGVGQASDPKSTFNAFYVFVFYFACAMWALEARIAKAELAAREHMLRLECRLADLAERLGK